MIPLLAPHCLHCGSEVTPILQRSGSHVKMSCGGCGRYIKFIASLELPELEDVKREIWNEVKYSMQAMEQVASELKLPPQSERTYFDWWKLYREITERIES